jgi:hypothetical protein
MTMMSERRCRTKKRSGTVSGAGCSGSGPAREPRSCMTSTLYSLRRRPDSYLACPQVQELSTTGWVPAPGALAALTAGHNYTDALPDPEPAPGAGCRRPW